MNYPKEINAGVKPEMNSAGREVPATVQRMAE